MFSNTRQLVVFLAFLCAIGTSCGKDDGVAPDTTPPVPPPGFVLAWGAQGSGDGQFDRPVSIAVDVAGNVYVLDLGNDRVQKFDGSGTFITKWGSHGSLDGQFQRPAAIALDTSGNVYVGDIDNHRIQKFDDTGGFLSKFGTLGSGDGEFNLPSGIAIDGSGNIYVVDAVNNRVQKFDPSGALITKWGETGSGTGQFFLPEGIALDQDGNVYVSDTSNDRVQKFDADGNFIMMWGFKAGAPDPYKDGGFASPVGLAVDRKGRVYVADVGLRRIQRFDGVGGFLDKWGEEGAGNGQFGSPGGAGPIDIAIDSSGNVFVVDMGNNRIQKFR